MWIHDLLFEQIFLIKEKNNRRVLKPRIGNYSFEQRFTLFHSVLWLCMENNKKVLRLVFIHTQRSLFGYIRHPIRYKLPTSLSDSNRIWSYSLKATKKIIEVTFSKQWIHFLLSDRCPPTSTILKMRWLLLKFSHFRYILWSIEMPYLNIIESRSNGYSMIPVVGTLTLKMSCCVGR